METTPGLPANEVAERIVQHFQAEGFVGISEALILRVGLRKGDRMLIDSAFKRAADQDKTPPAGEYFEIRPYGHFSGFRSFDEAKRTIQSDFSTHLRNELPSLFFDPAPLMIDDALASGTKYDAMIKLSDNVGGYAFAILVNDPESSLLEYLGTHHGDDWQKIVGDFSSTAAAFGEEIEWS